MKVYDKLIKPIYEVNYLRAENVDRYRLIIRYFFLEYEKMHYWQHKEDIYSQIHQLDGYESYTIEQCQQDLQKLVEWGNLAAMQDSNKVKTVEDFKNKKYRYQLSEYTVAIERMTLQLENLEIEGASLEPTLFERIYQQLANINEIKEKPSIDVNGWLQLLMSDFKRLNQNYQDYIKTLNSAKAEELMKTTEFLIYKDKIIMYLRTFVIAMQNTGNLISLILSNINLDDLELIFDKATQYELSIPRIERQLVYDEVYQNFSDKWKSLDYWFVGENGENEMDRIYDITNEIIRKMTRYAQQISEMINRGSNRKEQYSHIAEVFGKCRNVNEAHCLSAFVFGVEDCLHLNYIQPRASEDIHVGVYQEKPSEIRFDSHSRIVRKKYVRTPAKDYSYERRESRLKKELELEEQRKKIQKLIVDHEIDFANLPKVDSSTRKMLLIWLSKALGQEFLTSKNEFGEVYRVDKSKMNETCTLMSEDGDFIMPAFKLIFEE